MVVIIFEFIPSSGSVLCLWKKVFLIRIMINLLFPLIRHMQCIFNLRQFAIFSPWHHFNFCNLQKMHITLLIFCSGTQRGVCFLGNHPTRSRHGGISSKLRKRNLPTRNCDLWLQNKYNTSTTNNPWFPNRFTSSH